MPLFGEGDHGKDTRFGGVNENPPKRGQGRPSKLDDPEMQRQVADAFVLGLTREEMARTFHVSPATISNWRRDPRIKAHAFKAIEDRVLQITRKVDAEMQRRLSEVGNMSIRELLEVRKEYLGGVFRQQIEGVDDETTTQAMALLEKDPDLAKRMIELLTSSADDKPLTSDDIPTTPVAD